MKRFLFFCFLLITALSYAQVDSTRKIEPAQETSYTNKDLLLISLVGLALLVAIYFLFRRARGTKN